MKKLLLYLVMVLVSILISCEIDDGSGTTEPTDPEVAEITILTPDSGDSLSVAGSYLITWDSKNITEKINIDYSTDNGINWINISSNLDDFGTYIWKPIPNSISDACKVRVETIDSTTTGVSDGVFSIGVFTVNVGQELIVTAPNGGESWTTNSAKEISWYSTLVENVKIDYTTDNGVSWTPIADNVPSNGLYLWDPIPNTLSNNAKIRITNISGGFPVDESDVVFSIVPEEFITILSPNGGEVFQSGSSQYISWQTSIPGPAIVVQPGTGDGNLMKSGRVKNKSNKLNKGKSGSFTNTKFNSTKFTSGGGNEVSSILSVKIEFSENNGASWTLITESTPNNGSFLWSSVPEVNSALCVIRISEADDGLPFDISDASFAITNEVVKSIQLVSPNGGETWEANTSKLITWNSSGIERVGIQFTTNNGLEWNDIVDNLSSSGSYDWTVPNINSTQAKIKIYDADDGAPSDESNGTFVIKQAGSLQLTKPESGEVWTAGVLDTIRWDAENVEKVKIEYTTTNAVYDPEANYFDDEWFDLVIDAPGAVGFYVTRFTIISTDYRLRISDAELGSPVDFSGLFTVVKQPSRTITVLEPAAGDKWYAGASDNIEWTSENIENVQIEYTTNNGASWSVITNSTESDGVYSWDPIPMVSSSLSKIRISDAEDDQYSGVSGEFEIINENQLLVVTYPNEEVQIISGSSVVITWLTTGVTNVKIDYTYNNGIDWSTIVESTPSDGYYTWAHVPNTVSTNCKIRISDAEDGSPSDESDQLFVIYPNPEPYITILSPQGGNFISGTSTSITWQSENVAFIKIEFTSNGGADWEVVTDSTESDGAYLWNDIPAVNSSLCRVRLSDAADDSPFDISGFFKISDKNIVEQAITLLAPNGGEEFEAGTSQNITWDATAIDSVDLEYSTDNGNTWNIIATGVPGAAYEWGLPINLNSPLTKVRVSDSEDNDPFDVSNASFTVRPAQSITVLSPTSGASFASGEPITIEWIATGMENVGIQYTTTNGLGSGIEPPFHTLTASTPNTGKLETSFSIPSKLYYVQIFDASDAAPMARSIGNFSVTEQVFGSITVLDPAPGDTLYSGTYKEIKWSAQYVENVKIEFSQNFGATWQTIVENTPSDGSYIWGPIPQIISDLCAIRISDASRSEVSGMSLEPFVIAKQVQQIAGEPASIYLVSQTYESIGVTESGSPETSQITFEVQDSSGLPIDFAHAVDVSFRFGARPNGGEFLAPAIAETDENGRVNVNLSSGTIAGSVQVIAEIGFGSDIIRSRPVNIAIHGGLPNLAHFAVATAQLNYPYYNVLNGIGSVTAVVGDKYSNPVKQGTAVYFSTDAGVVEGSDLTDDLGRAVVTLVSGAPIPNDPVYGAGFFWVTGQTINESDVQITTDALVLYSGTPSVSVTPTSFNIPNGGSVAFTYTIKDQNDNPLAPGNRYTVSAGGGGVTLGGQTSVTMPDVQFGNTTFSFTVSDGDAADIDPPKTVTITISTNGPNGVASTSISGSAD